MSEGVDGPALELPAETMRAQGYAVVDHLVARLEGLGDGPAWRGASRDEMRARMPDGGIDRPTPFPTLLEHLTERVLPYRGNVDHPRFFAFVPGCPTWPGILADFLAAGHNVFQGTWLESAGPSALELEVLDWFREWIGYPTGAAGLLGSGGSAANLTALVTARNARLGESWGDGVVYLSGETHSSVVRAARILGFHPDRIRTLPVDGGLRLDVDALVAAVAEDRRRGLRPFLVAANGGATSTGTVDPLPALSAFCRREGLWLHVDAAYGGFAVLVPAGRAALEGLGDADSVTLDPHKWLYQPFEAGCLLVRDGRRLAEAFHIMPDYLQDTEVDRTGAPDAGEVNFADRGPQLTRSFRALKIWMTIRYYGLDALRATIERTLALARQAEARIRGSSRLELLTPARLGVLCFRGRDGEQADQSRVRRLAESGIGMVSSTRVRGEYALRLCILNHRTRWPDVERVITALED
ncbi:MAG: aminotransferase class V-fold PLP-dependent enzyme [Gemmatimonadota bacterium]|jgi:aromatic-L-amino-acid decarboxylase